MKSAIICAVFSLFVTSFVYAGYPVNINTADAQELAEALDGVGLSKAQAIVEYRSSVGEFHTAADLVNVKGIGAKTVERNKDYIQLTSDSGSDIVLVE